MSSDTRKIVYSIIGTALTFALTLNVYFVKRLVDQVDETRDITLAVRTDLTILKARLAESWGNGDHSVKSCKKGSP